MKKTINIMLSALIIAAMFVVSGCSSSDKNDGGEENIVGVITGSVLEIGDYTLTLYADNYFDAINNATNQLYEGRYTFDNSILNLFQVATRAFSLEPGKNYSFKVETNDDGAITFTNVASGEKFAVVKKSSAPVRTGHISAQEEKEYIKKVAEELEAYAVADEWKEYSNVARELREVDGEELEDYVDGLFQETVSQPSKSNKVQYYNYDGTNYTYDEYGNTQYGTIYRIDTYTYNYEYYDRVLLTTQAKGEFVANYKGKWRRVKDTGDLKLTYTDKNGAAWVLSVQSSGSIGKIRTEEGRDYYYGYGPYVPTIGPNDIVRPGYDYTYKYTSKTQYIELPKQATATLTRNGEKRVEVKVDIKNFGNREAQSSRLSLIGQSDGTASVYLKPAGDALVINSTFNYANGSKSNAEASVKKGNVTLLEVSASCTPRATGREDISSVANASITATVLQKLTVRMSTGEAMDIRDAIRDADDRRNDEDVVKNSREKINHNLVAYITNGVASSTKQADFVVDIKSKDEGYYDYSHAYNGNTWVGPEYKTRKVFELVPALKFSDNSSYAFSNYFTESFFKTVIDKAEQLGEDFRNLIEIWK